MCITKGYWIDTYEVTNAACQQFIDAGGYSKREYWSLAGWHWKDSLTEPVDCLGNSGGSGTKKFNNPQQPRVCVSWYEAEAYAKWRGGRLPTEAEWEYAARGSDSLTYPWGDLWDGRTANSLEAKYGETKLVGSYKDGKSWVGAYDMAGNVNEWVMDWYDEKYYTQRIKDDPMGPTTGDSRGIWGGSWAEMVQQSAFRLANYPSVTESTLGFRIVSGVAPLATPEATAQANIPRVHVPAGCFMMDSSVKGGTVVPDSGHKVCITRDYWIDTYEVTNAAYQQFIDAGGYQRREFWSDAGWVWGQKAKVSWPSESRLWTDPQLPRTGVSWYEAEAYAK